MDKRRLNNAIEHARITVTEVQNDSLYLDPSISIRPIKGSDHEYTNHIGGLNTEDMIFFMNWFKEVKPDWLEGIEQDFDDGWILVK
ncbi:MAG: hypothetical protein HOU59_gp32 (endogenous virus) [Lactobacillus phage ViSo-2018a]|uniref:Uncharacterized protein n=1 Tax=Lactobacillus phage ViSo-2018a TaxID=2267607 RepID=A0A3G6JGW4_9CAUD|nr:MAG: hypothetical protein HOU59_gp32 [Lactobacillus phage ViSo-2018a]AZA17297.1 MAG: hypothetical protein DQL93_0590 [Lactobacillus phage ViSo-2018a]